MEKEFENLVQEYLTDGIISAKERAVLLKKAEKLGIDVDEADLYIEAQQQKEDMKTELAAKKKKGKTCPFCEGSINDFTDKCPHCGGNVTPEATRELQEMLDNLEDALVSFKAGRNIAEAKAMVERYARKASLYYSNNSKVTLLLEEIKKELAEVETKAKKQAVLNALAKRWKLIAGVVVVIVLAIVIMIKNRPTPANDAATCIEMVNKAVKSGNLAQAEVYCASYLSESGQYRGDIMSALVMVAEAYIEKGEVEKAASFCATNYIEDVAGKIVDACIAAGKVDLAATACGSGLSGLGAYHSIAEPNVFKVQDAYIKLGEYEKAEKCIDYHGCTDEYFDFLCKCLDQILENDGKVKAKSFIDRKVGHYSSRLTHEAEWQQGPVKRRLYEYAGL